MLYSCSSEMESISPDQENNSIDLVINVNGPDTKTENFGNSTVWSEGDALSIFHSTSGSSAPNFWTSWFGFYYGNSFQGTVSKLSATNDWYAVYPYREENVSPAKVRLSFPSKQIQVGNSNLKHFAGETFPMFGKTANVPRAEELNISMVNLLSGVQFKIQNTTESPIVIQEVEFKAESYISGGFLVDMTGDSPIFTHDPTASKQVTLTVTDGDEIQAGETAYFNAAIAPYDIPAGGHFLVKVIGYHPSAPESKVFFYITKTVQNGTSFQPGHIKVVNVPFDEEHSQNPDAGSAGEAGLEPGEQPGDGVYLLVYENGENSMAFAPFSDQKENKYAIPVSVVDGTVIPEDGQDLSNYAVTIEVATDETGTPIEHSNDAGHYAYNVRNSIGQYVFYSTQGGNLDASDALQIKDINEMDIDGTVYQYYHTFVQATDGIQVLSSIYGANGGNAYLLAYSEANGFYYEENNSGQKLHLYLLGGTAKEKQYPVFSSERVEYDFDTFGSGVLENAPTLNGAMTAVTYSSSNESVASVDSSGIVTIHKAGSATITAKAEANENFYAAKASYLVVATTSVGTTFYRVTELNAGEQYVIISNEKALTNDNGTIGATDITAAGDEILIVEESSLTWTATASGDGFTLSNNGYYVQRASSSGGGKPNISNNPNTSYYVWDYSNNHLSTGSYYLYYSSGWSQTSSSSSAGTVIIYSSTKPLEKQSLSFTNGTMSFVVGESCEIGSTFNVQAVSGAQTPVTYASSNSNVATVSGTTITVAGYGSTTITATAEADEVYKSATASYTLRINKPAPEGFTSLGTFNLENSTVSSFITAANSQYTDDNYASVSIVSQYTNNGRPSTRLDVPEPVRLKWDTAASGTATVTVYYDQALTKEVWTWTATKGSTYFDVYNLIPGETYFCTVVDNENADFLLKGTFSTEGRRRMLKVSDTESANNANNCRDLGGLKAAGGKRIKYGMIYRGTNLTGTTAAEKKYLAEFMNIGLDNDLRDGSGGSSNRDNPFQNTSYDVVYCGPGYGTGIGSTTGSSLTNPERAAETMQAFIDCALRGKASYFHCYIGSDRTGYWGFLLESLLGVSPKDASIDFELTGFAGRITSGDRPRNATNYTYYQGMDYFKGKSYYNGNMQETVIQYLTDELHISSEDIQAFLNAVLEDDPEQN